MRTDSWNTAWTDNDPFGRDSYRIKEREPGKKIKKNSSWHELQEVEETSPGISKVKTETRKTYERYKELLTPQNFTDKQPTEYVTEQVEAEAS